MERLSTLQTFQNTKHPALSNFFISMMSSAFTASKKYMVVSELSGQQTCLKAGVTVPTLILLSSVVVMENWILHFFLWQPFTYLKTDIVHLSLSSLDPLTSDYFATRLVISGHFYVLSSISFRSNFFCTVASFWILQWRLTRAEISSPPRRVC